MRNGTPWHVLNGPSFTASSLQNLTCTVHVDGHPFVSVMVYVNVSMLTPFGGSDVTVYFTHLPVQSALEQPLAATHATEPYVPCVKPPAPVRSAQFNGRGLTSLARTLIVAIAPIVAHTSAQSAAHTGDAIVTVTVQVDVQPNESVIV